MFGKEKSVIHGQMDLHLVVRIIPTLHLLSTISHVGQIVHCDPINAKNVLNETCFGVLKAWLPLQPIMLFSRMGKNQQKYKVCNDQELEQTENMVDRLGSSFHKGGHSVTQTELNLH